MFNEITREYLLNSFSVMEGEGWDFSDKEKIINDTIMHFEAKYGVVMPENLIRVVRTTVDKYITK